MSIVTKGALLPALLLLLGATSCGEDETTTATTATSSTGTASTTQGSATTTTAQSGAASSSTGMDPPRPPPYDWMFIVGTGQSLSVGAAAGGNVSETQPFGNLKLVDRGPDPKYPIDGGMPVYATAPLTEPIRNGVAGSGPGYDDGQYPNNIGGETPHSAMANQISEMWKSRPSSLGDYVTAHAVVGWSGHPLVDIDKAGMKRAYPASLVEARAFKELAMKEGKTFGAGAVILTHGESDAGNGDYGAGLATLWADYNTDLKAITGQSEDILLLVSQQSTIASGPGGSAVQVFEAGREHAGKIVCVGPKYAYEYAGDLIHLPAGGYIRLGQKYGEVFDKIRNQGIDWKPLGPNMVTRNGATIVVAFDVPTPPLVWEENISPPHQSAHTAWRNGRGFELVGPGGAELEIASAEIRGNTVVLTMTDPPAAGTPIDVRYAIVQDGDGLQGGTDLGLRGQLRDSNEVDAYDRVTLEVAFEAGSPNVTATDDGDFRFRAGFDRVTATSLPAGTMVRRVVDREHLVLSAPWSGQSEVALLTFERDLYNYAVHFSVRVE